LAIPEGILSTRLRLRRIPLPDFFNIDKEIPQSTIITGQLSPGKNNPVFYAFTVLDLSLAAAVFRRVFSVPSAITKALPTAPAGF